MVVTSDEEIALRVRRFNSLGYASLGATKGRITRDEIQDPNYVRHVSVGFNYRMPELCAAVALAQTERATELVERRKQVAACFSAAVAAAEWLVPQAVPPGYVHSYWTYVVRLASDAPVNWYEFRARFREGGGDGIYAAWRINYLEPAFLKWRSDSAPPSTQRYGPELCPVAERLQPRLLQFKTNYWDEASGERQAQILADTIRACEQG